MSMADEYSYQQKHLKFIITNKRMTPTPTPRKKSTVVFSNTTDIQVVNSIYQTVCCIRCISCLTFAIYVFVTLDALSHLVPIISRRAKRRYDNVTLSPLVLQ